MYESFDGADDRTRTDDLLITNQLLYQLSYVGAGLASFPWRRVGPFSYAVAGASPPMTTVQGRTRHVVTTPLRT